LGCDTCERLIKCEARGEERQEDLRAASVAPGGAPILAATPILPTACVIHCGGLCVGVQADVLLLQAAPKPVQTGKLGLEQTVIMRHRGGGGRGAQGGTQHRDGHGGNPRHI
jgi:hypothetical protein